MTHMIKSLKMLILYKHFGLLVPIVMEEIKKISNIKGNIAPSLDVLGKLYSFYLVSQIAKREKDIRIKSWGEGKPLYSITAYGTTIEEIALAKEMYKLLPEEDVLLYIKTLLPIKIDFDKFHIPSGYIPHPLCNNYWMVCIWDKNLSFEITMLAWKKYSKMSCEYNRCILFYLGEAREDIL